jgi:MtaA/CmuA family methyltransferase
MQIPNEPLTPLERYRRAANNQPVDFLPRIPILMQFAAEYIGSNYGAFASDYRVRAEANLRCARDFGIDQMNTMSDPYCETTGFGAQIVYATNSVPHIVSPPLEEDMDFLKLPRPDCETSARLADRISAVRSYAQSVGGQSSIMGWVEGPAAEAADLRGVSNFFCDLLEEPEYAGGLMDFCTDFAIEFAGRQIAAGADTIGIGDAVCSQVSADVYEELIWPREKRLVTALREMGALVRLHICGNITHILPGIARLGINVIDIDHAVDLRTARKALGTGVAISGNLNPVSDVMRSTPDRIRARVLECYRQAGNPFIVNAGCEIPAATPHENLKALCEPVAYDGTL